MKEVMEAADLLERLTQAWFRAAWAKDEQTMLREHGLMPPNTPKTNLISPMDAVLEALSEVLQSLVALPVAGINALLDLASGDADAAEAGKPPLETPPIPPEKVGVIDEDDWKAFAAALDKVPGMDVNLKYALMMTIAWEGGSNPNGDVLTGITNNSMTNPETLKRLPAYLQNKQPKEMTVSERVQVIEAHLDATLATAGGLKAVREAFPDKDVLSVVLDTAYQRGMGHGSEIFRRAIGESLSSAARGENPWFGERYSPLSRETLAKMKTITSNPANHESFRRAIQAERDAWSEAWAKVQKSKTNSPKKLQAIDRQLVGLRNRNRFHTRSSR